MRPSGLFARIATNDPLVVGAGGAAKLLPAAPWCFTSAGCGVKTSQAAYLTFLPVG